MEKINKLFSNSRGFSLIFVVIIIVLIFYILTLKKFGKRRSSKKSKLSKNKLFSNRETGLIEQWYSDQPIQRIFSICFSHCWSELGISTIQNRSIFKTAIKKLIHKHPTLSYTIRRCNSTREVSISSPIDNEHFEFDQYGDLPIIWVSRDSDATFHKLLHDLTNRDMDESSWLFRVAIILPSCSPQDGLNAEIIIALHHMICDGLSSTILMRDLLEIISNQASCKIGTDCIPRSPNQFQIMDDVIDLRLPFITILKAICEDSMPAWARKKNPFYKGPQPICKNPNHSYHHSILLLNKNTTKRLLSLAKAKKVSINGLLSSILAQSEAMIIQHFPPPATEETENFIKLQIPFGKAVRRKGNVPPDQVGVFISSHELLLDVSSETTSQNWVWSTAKNISEATNENRNLVQSLNTLGLLSFLPRISLTPWFLKESCRYRQGKAATLDVSNLGKLDELNQFIQNNDVSNLFSFKSPQSVGPFVVLCQGRGFRTAVLNIGIATLDETLSISISCDLSQCGCKDVVPHQSMVPNLESKQFQKLHKDSIGVCICDCPKQKFLRLYSDLVLQNISGII